MSASRPGLPVRRSLGVLVALAVLASACTAGSGGSGPPDRSTGVPAPDPAAPTRLAGELSGPFDEGNLGAAVEALARAGVEVWDDELTSALRDVVEPASPVRFIRFQVRNMALEVARGGGILGMDLDALAGHAGGKRPSVSAAVAGYVVSGSTFGADLSRELLEGSDMSSSRLATFPLLVLALFLSDNSRHRASASPTASAFGGEVTGIPGAELVAALRQGGGCGPAGGFLGGVIGGIFGLFVKGTLVGRALAALSVLVTVGSMLRVWTVTVTAEPGSSHYQVGDAPPIDGAFTATVDPGGTYSWPPIVSDCAALLGIDLPEPADAPGSPIAWNLVSGFPQHSETPGPLDSVVDEDDTAVLPFRVSGESSTAHEGGEEQSGTAVVEATVARQDRRQLGELIAGLLGPLGRIPGAAGLLRSALYELTEATDPSGTGVLEVTFHPSAYHFLYQEGFWTLQGYTCDGLRSTWTATISFQHAAAMNFSQTESLNVEDGSAPWNWHAEDEIGSAVITWDGRQRVSIGGTADAPTFDVRGTITAGGTAPGFGVSRGPLPVESVSIPIETGAEECG